MADRIKTGFADIEAAKALVRQQRAARRAPRIRDVAPIDRPAYAFGLAMRVVKKLAPTNLLVEATEALSSRIERYVEGHGDSPCPQHPERLSLRVARWLIEAPAHGREAREPVDHRDAGAATVSSVSRAFRPGTARLRLRPAGAPPAKTGPDCSLRLLPEPGQPPHPSEDPAIRPQSTAPALRSDPNPSTHPLSPSGEDDRIACAIFANRHKERR